MRLKNTAIFFLIAAVAGAGGFIANQYLSGSGVPEAEAASIQDAGQTGLIGQKRPDYTHGNVNGDMVSAAEFDGRVVLVNFWATWCAPCREEMPMLMELRERYLADGFEVLGIAIDDVAAAREFVDELGIQYPNLVGSVDVMQTLTSYGNTPGTLPYSVLIDHDGIIRWTHMGVLKEPDLEGRIEALLEGI